MKQPQVIDKSEEEIEAIVAIINESLLPDYIKVFVVKCIELAIWFPIALNNKTISLHRLRSLIFGKGYSTGKNKSVVTEKSKVNEDVEQDGEKYEQEPETVNLENEENSVEPTVSPNKKEAGHGRMPHTVYENYTEVKLTINGLKIGDPCPKECGGKLRDYKPGAFVRVVGQNFADVKKYIVEKFRCNLCGLLVGAEIPAEVGNDKYDASFKAILAIQKYYVAVPFYRQEYFQVVVGFRLPDATQWDLCEQVGGCGIPVFNQLIKLAGNGNNVSNDDSHVKILEVIKELKKNPDAKRKGMFTTSIIAEYEGHKIALFMNGTKHAGENLADVLKHRAPNKPPPIQMCDASNNNIPNAMVVILCNCLSHGFRKFEELIDFFPEECLKIMKKISHVYKNDEQTKGMTKEERLGYHQEHSQPVMDELKLFIDNLLSGDLIEPNSDLRKSLRYMQKHWLKLTRFLSVAGAPLDNNVVERALKVAIRNRKAAMFYRTRYSAYIGGVLTSLIYTCHLAGENAHHYLIALQQYKRHVLASPGEWLPWNYRDTLLKLKPIAATNGSPKEHSPPLIHPVAA